jgi:CheY-like chemotaxis protein
LNDDTDFDLVLMDLMMPDMDGFKTIEQIRSDPELETLAIVALSARTSDEDRNQAMSSGANDYLCKPVEPAALKMILDRHLGSRLVDETATREQEKT